MLCTGYSNQSKMLSKYLEEKGHTIHWLANGYSGATMNGMKLDDGTELNCKIYGHSPSDQYFNRSISKHLKDTNSEIFFILLDTFMLHGDPNNPQNGWFLKTDTSPAKTFFWFPSDGGSGMPDGCELILNKIDVPVAMARFGQKQVKDYYGIDAKHIPHGLDIKRFFKLTDEERTQARMKLGFNDKFVIGVVARNQPRKNLDRTIKAMSLIKTKIPNAVLYLHLDPSDPAQPYSLNKLIVKYGLENRVFFSGMEAHKGFGWDKMNAVYGVMDCFFLSTSGEGFGIPIIEAMACGVPVVATDYTTTPELVKRHNAGLGINLSGVEEQDMFLKPTQEYDINAFDGTQLGSWGVERGFCSITDAAEKIKYLSEHPKECKEMGERGREAVLKEYDFEIVGKAWEELFNDTSD